MYINVYFILLYVIFDIIGWCFEECCGIMGYMMVYDVLLIVKRKNEKFFYFLVDLFGMVVYIVVGKYDLIWIIDGYFGIVGVL